MTHNDDDLGQDLNLTIGGTAIARAAVEQWPIAAAGHRPIDHIARDVLTAPCLRDPQQWLFRILSANPPAWISRRTHAVADKLRKQASQMCTLHFLHEHHLYQLTQSLAEPRLAVVARLQRCWPSGLLVRWAGPGRRGKRDYCDLARQCPFCFARRVVALYEELDSVLRPGAAHNVLLVARAILSDEAFAVTPELTLHERCRLVRKRLGAALIRDARAIGAVGGVITFTVAPRLSRKWTGDNVEPDPNAGFEFRVSLLGRIPTYRPELASLRNSGRGPAMKKFDELGSALNVQYQVLRGSQALRLALAGSSSGYKANGLANVEGVFSWPSWNLADAGQWVAHREATRHMQLYTSWGSIESPSIQKQAPQRSNSARQPGDLERRERLLQRLEELIACDPDLRNCGHVKLRRKFEEDGPPISEREAKWLRTHLVNDAGEPLEQLAGSDAIR